MSEPALELDGIVKTFQQGGARLEVLRGVTLSIAPREMVALMGPSGSGKSTLLHIAGLLERPTSGEVMLWGEPCSGLSDDRRTLLRRERIGFVYQFHHLLPEFSALENVMLPRLIAGRPRDEARNRARELLKMVGLESRESHRPARLSGGEQQRVAIARALASAPREGKHGLLLADEPTGNLDERTAEAVFEVLRVAVGKVGVAALIATHNNDLAARMDRALTLRDGAIVAG